MRLYKMELYKICHRKIFIVGIVCTIVILLLSLWMNVAEEFARVDGRDYEGYQAIQINRKITKEFEGVLTDEKVEKIVERYGFPQKIQEGYGRFLDANFLNDFVVRYLSDGYFYSWDNYQIATCTYPIAETELGEVKKLTGKEIILEYNNGWSAFLDILQIGMILGSIIIIFGISTIFSMEGQTKMLQLIFTTKEGKRKDIFVKIAAAFTVAIGIWLGIVILDLILCGSVYGFGGLHCLIGMTKKISYIIRALSSSPTILSVKDYIAIALLRGFLGMMLLCATTICISACFQNSFYAVVSAAICYGAPIFIWIMLGSGFFFFVRLIIYATPLYMMMDNAIFDIYRIWIFYMGLDVAACILVTFKAYRRYRRQQIL